MAVRTKLPSARVVDVVRAIVEVGGDYGNVMEAMKMAKQKDYLAARLEVDATPYWGRKYRRNSAGVSGAIADERAPVNGPLPDLFENPLARENYRQAKSKDEGKWDISPEDSQAKEKGFWEKTTGWLRGQD